jgi:hypothetical protein
LSENTLLRALSIQQLAVSMIPFKSTYRKPTYVRYKSPFQFNTLKADR